MKTKKKSCLDNFAATLNRMIHIRISILNYKHTLESISCSTKLIFTTKDFITKTNFNKFYYKKLIFEGSSTLLWLL